MQIKQQVGLSYTAAVSYVGYDRMLVVDTTSYALRVMDGSTPGGHLHMLAENNLNDVSNVASARSNLGLGSAASLASSAVLQTGNAFSEIASAGTQSTARGNLGLGSAAVQSTTYFLQTSLNLSDVTASTARTNLGLGTFATKNVGTGFTVDGSSNASVTYGTASGTAAVGNDSRITGAMQKSSNLSDVANASTARANLGVAIGSNVQAYSAALTTLAAGTGTGLTSLNASSLSTGTVPAVRLPYAAASALGGVFSKTNATNQVLTYLNTSGAFGSATASVTIGSTSISALGGSATTIAGLELTGKSTAVASTSIGATFGVTVPYASAINTTAYALTQVASLTLSAGSYLLWAQGAINRDGTNGTGLFGAGLSTSASVSSIPASFSDGYWAQTRTYMGSSATYSTFKLTCEILPIPITITSTTTYYLYVMPLAESGEKLGGFIRAVRIA
jgi:hypothetical protein